MNSDETWLLYLFSGLFGAVISGVVAAVVAMLLLRKTNQHVSKEAIRNITEQRRLASQDTKMAEARADRALKEQRREAALAREVAVRAELIGVLSEFGAALEKQSEIDFDDLDRKIAILIQQWRINLDPVEDDELRGELQAWCGLFSDTMPNVDLTSTSSDGQITIRRGLSSLQQAAINYRDTTRGNTWHSAGTAEFLGDAQMALHDFNADYYCGHTDNKFAPTTPEARRFPQDVIDKRRGQNLEAGHQ